MGVSFENGGKGAAESKGRRSSAPQASQQTSTLSVGHCGFMTEKITTSCMCACIHACILFFWSVCPTYDLAVKVTAIVLDF